MSFSHDLQSPALEIMLNERFLEFGSDSLTRWSRFTFFVDGAIQSNCCWTQADWKDLGTTVSDEPTQVPVAPTAEPRHDSLFQRI